MKQEDERKEAARRAARYYVHARCKYNDANCHNCEFGLGQILSHHNTAEETQEAIEGEDGHKAWDWWDHGIFEIRDKEVGVDTR